MKSAMSNHCTIVKQGVWIYIDVILSDLVIRVCGGGGGGTLPLNIVEMQPRWYTDLIIINKLEL